MALELSLINKQRRIKVDLEWLNSTCTELLGYVCQDLRDFKAKHISKKFIDSFQKQAAVSLVLVSNKQIQMLNKQWRGKDKATDVLSFAIEEEPPQNDLPWEIGEIVISVEKAYEQAKDLGHSKERELGFLFVHGVLHILGFDHEIEAEAKEMFGRQARILKSAKLSRH